MLDALQQGEPRAWQAFCRDNAGLVLHVVRQTFGRYGFRGGPEDMEDVGQEVFIRLSKQDFALLKRFDPARAKLSTFLRVVASSTAIDWLRRRRPQAEDIEDHASALVDERADAAFDAIGRSETALQAVEEEVGAAGLSDRQRVILRLMFDEDMDVEDIAEKLGIAAQTVRSAKHKALTKLRDAYEAKRSTEARGT
jgi:RNA polymerase sigma-70 factor (ECF subfamily)